MATGNASAVPSTGNSTGSSTTNVPAGNPTGQSATANTTTTTSSGASGAVDQAASSGQILDWEDVDRFSFEDSDHFEEDSLCSWSSEPESLCNNWRGWRRPTAGFTTIKKSSEDDPPVPTLCELAARCVASHIPFELVEHVYPPVPEQLQLRIAFWSFPDNEEDIRLYSCLANGSADEFQRGEQLYRSRSVKNPLQIGFHLSASVNPQLISATSGVARSQFNVAVTFDRRKITSCNCTCSSKAYWCAHVVAVCLHRIHMPTQVCLRAPVSESLSRLHRDQLQKFAQYLISELPQQILPTAQSLLDELLSAQPNAINSYCGAPDPTAGASAHDQTSWYLDEKTLHDNIKKILIKFCVPAPIVFSDVNYLSTTAPPAATEWSSLLRPLRGREPEGMWNLLSIVREMFKRTDRNAIPLLEIITEECMACEQIIVWWFNTKVALLNGTGHGGGKHGNMNSNVHASQHACSSLCDEIVVLWRLAALNPGLSPAEREMLHEQFLAWHMKIIDKVTKSRGTSVSHNSHNRNNSISYKDSLKNDLTVFVGFKTALEACYLDWEEYTLPGITYTAESNPMYHCPFTCFRHVGDSSNEVNQVNSSSAVLNCQPPISHHHSRRPISLVHVEFSYTDRRRLNPREFPGLCSRGSGGDGNRSSVSSEGFCENDTDMADISEPRLLRRRGCTRLNNCGDTDSQEGGGSESSSNSNVSLKNVEGTNKHSSNISSESQSDSSESSNNKATNEVKCSRTNFVDYRDKSRTVTTKTTGTKTEQESERENDASRRQSKDESSSSSSDSPSGDEYNVYYYDSKATLNNTGTDSKTESPLTVVPSANTLLGNLKKIEDPWGIFLARAEGLYAHGHTREACILGVQLAEELLANPPDLMIEEPPLPSKGKKKKQQVNPASHQLTCLASATLAKCCFLCTVLAENPENHNLAFRVGLYGLEMARPPANTKPLEVKLVHQESELVSLLKKIPLGQAELNMVRQRAAHLRDGVLRSRGHALLPIILASFIFDTLNTPRGPDISKESDEDLGFDAAVAALGLKANVSEADHPLLCEGTRRQRGDLAITLLVHYKDAPAKVARIMNKLLDSDIHQLIKSPILISYYTANLITKPEMTNHLREDECLSPLTGTDVGNGDNAISNGSRPHSSTSAELENSMNAFFSTTTLQPPLVQTVPTRNKETRYKSKRICPSIPNQPSEAGAHFMCELAKTVLAKAGGSSSTSLFTQVSTNQNHHVPHRALHMCAFQLGLYALGLHNCVSHNWLSRTYSTHVSWITGQAVEIGAPAIWFLIESWEGHLTPPEAVSIADKSSRGSDPNMVRAAAELALSCLPHAHALNPNEVQRAILQCKEQSDVMLEKACITVENTAKGGGVYPEVLFQVAKYWYELYIRHTPGGEQQDEMPHDSLQLDLNSALLVEPGPPVDLSAGQMIPGPTQAVVVTSTQPPPQPYPAHPTITTLAPLGTVQQYYNHEAQIIQQPGVGMPYAVAPYSFVHPHHSIPTFGGPMPTHRVTLPPAPPHLQMYHTAFPPHPRCPQHPQHPQHPHHPPPTAQPPPPVPQYYAPQPPPPPGTHHLFTMQQTMPVNVQAGVTHGPIPGQSGLPGPALVQAQPIISTVRPQPQVHNQNQRFRHQQFRALVAAYRVGMLALETLARRVHDDRPQAKYARNPPYGEDVKWLFRVSKRLGSQYLHQLCVCTVNSIVSPFVLHEVALEAAHYLSRNNPTLVLQHLRSAPLAPLVHKCQQMYIQCMHQKLYHLAPSDYEDFASVVCAARAAFHITPEGHTQFKEWLQSIKRSKSCNKELWAQINAALQQNGK